MNCALCNGTIHEIKKGYLFESKILGTIFVPNVTFEECLRCGDKTFSLEESENLIAYVRTQELKAIGELPSNDLASLTEAAAILGMSKQGFSQKPKIKRGFIYSIKVGNRKLYFKKSLLLFKETGDGRFPLVAWVSTQTKPQPPTYTTTNESDSNCFFSTYETSSENAWPSE